MSDSASPRPVTVVRAGIRPWGARLAWSTIGVVVGSAAVLAGLVEGVLATVTRVAVVVAFTVMVAALAIVTVRLRTSLRSDGASLVVRGPLGASIVPFHDGIAFGRWLDEAHARPVVWVLDRGAPVVPVDPRIEPLRVELFAGRVGLDVIDSDEPPPAPGGY